MAVLYYFRDFRGIIGASGELTAHSSDGNDASDASVMQTAFDAMDRPGSDGADDSDRHDGDGDGYCHSAALPSTSLKECFASTLSNVARMAKRVHSKPEIDNNGVGDGKCKEVFRIGQDDIGDLKNQGKHLAGFAGNQVKLDIMANRPHGTGGGPNLVHRLEMGSTQQSLQKKQIMPMHYIRNQ
ncbi:hypothetical protein C8R44DRAFT_733839 [Mycena epipterygia]|nr:hypothetical protein C8R44DRAFT_733839 [Mycena epipterygia]